MLRNLQFMYVGSKAFSRDAYLRAAQKFDPRYY